MFPHDISRFLLAIFRNLCYAVDGATSSTPGRRFPRFLSRGEYISLPLLQKGVTDMGISWSANCFNSAWCLFYKVIALVLQNNKERSSRPTFPKVSALLCSYVGEPTYWQHPLCLYYTPNLPDLSIVSRLYGGIFHWPGKVLFIPRRRRVFFVRRFMQTK